MPSRYGRTTARHIQRNHRSAGSITFISRGLREIDLYFARMRLPLASWVSSASPSASSNGGMYIPNRPR